MRRLLSLLLPFAGAALSGAATAEHSQSPANAADALLAADRDLGVTFGLIVPKPTAGEAPRAGIPFFTVWRRASPSVPWRYVAE